MINAISECFDPLRFQLKRRLRQLDEADRRLFDAIDDYLGHYCTYARVGPIEVAQMYMDFSERYMAHVKEFLETGLYPMDSENASAISRIEYDVFLLCSPLLTTHRFKLMELVNTLPVAGDRCAIIGAGAGLEMMLLNKRYTYKCAYDLEISDFVGEFHQDWKLHEKPFEAFSDEFDAIFAVELLEHLEDPQVLLGQMHGALKKGGECHVTTAKNVPQFDHLFNFTSSREFEESVEAMGFSITRSKVVAHDYLFTEIDANNVYYTLVKQ